MQGKGIVKFFLVLLTIVTLVQFLYMLPTNKVENKAAAFADKVAASASEEDRYAARKAAVAAVDKAASVKGEWRDTRWEKAKAVKIKMADGKTKKVSYLAAADHYHKMGDSENAMKYIEIVKFQGEAGYEQAMGQKNAGPRH